MKNIMIHLTNGNTIFCRKVEIVNGELIVDDSRKLDFDEFIYISVH